MKRKVVLSIVIASLMLGLVSCDHACKKQKKEVRKSWGAPEEIITYDSGGYHSHQWWYWSRGQEFTFTYGSNVDGCEFSQYSFSPISSIVITDVEKAIARESKVMVKCTVCNDWIM